MEYEKLCREVEAQLHRQMKTHGDFDFLSQQVEEKTKKTLSSSTLMRLWGYRPSLNTRRSTLDILANFLGYADYSHFLKNHGDTYEAEANAETEVEEASPAEEAPTVRRRWPMALAVAVALCLLVAGGWFLFRKSEPQPKVPVYLTSVQQLSNDRQYYIHTRNKQRGSLGVSDYQLATTWPEAKKYRCDSTSTFALIHYEGSYYMYSTEYRRFVNVMLETTDDPLRRVYAEKDWCAIDLHNRDEYFVFDFVADSSKGRIYSLNVHQLTAGLIITDVGTMNGVFNDGNLFVIEDAGPFDSTEAMQMIKKSEEMAKEMAKEKAKE